MVSLTLLQQSKDKDTNRNFRDDDVLQPIDDNDVEIPLLSHEEIKIAIMQLKDNKVADSDTMHSELFKAENKELHSTYSQNIAGGK